MCPGARMAPGSSVRTARARFAALAEEMLVRTGLPYKRISGSWEERVALAEQAIEELAAGG